MNVKNLMAELERRHPGENEYLQAVREVLTTVEEAYNQHPEFEANRIAERIVEPDRQFTFKVVWVDDNNGLGAVGYFLLNIVDIRIPLRLLIADIMHGLATGQSDTSGPQGIVGGGD